MTYFIKAAFFCKAWFKGLLGFFYLIFTLKFYSYLKIQNVILHKLSDLIDSSKRVVILSGGQSRSDLNYKDLNNTVFFLNSYNSLKDLSDQEKELILSKTILYYQAPYHKPISKESYIRHIEETCNALNSNAICIHNKSTNFVHKQLSEREFDFRSTSLVNQRWLKFRNTTGALFLINLARIIGLKEIFVHGFDANWFYTEINDVEEFQSKKKEVLNLFLWNYEILMQIKSTKKQVRKSSLKVNISRNSWYNIVG